MDRRTQEELNLNPRSDEELRDVITSFERKWQTKARHQLRTHRAM
ncbi:MAG TPA: hypothetical protein VGM08_04370 [Candidatus Saccharimonadales bacterium]|jgi:hypothetical protein